ncbi:MAG TPA: hypothetical protein VFD58_37145 [Blastocatellia bacterium]|nr:hypothetical protein [Blastocatellia bacterium]
MDCNYRCGCARLLRKDELTCRWQEGHCDYGCFNLTKPNDQAEIKPAGEYKLNVYWKQYVDDCDKPKSFVVEGKKRPLPGKYKIVVEYKQVIRPGSQPLYERYTAESPEFEIEY